MNGHPNIFTALCIPWVMIFGLNFSAPPLQQLVKLIAKLLIDALLAKRQDNNAMQRSTRLAVS
jgi:hypothetical protein